MIPVFVGGTGRCGTTVLKNVLDCHPCVEVIPHELRFLIDPDGALDLASALSDRWSPYNADVAIHRFSALLDDVAATAVSTSLLARAIRKGLVKLGMSPWRYGFLDVSFLGGRDRLSERLDELVGRLTHHRSRGVWGGSPAFKVRSVIHEAPPASGSDAALEIGRLVSELVGENRRNQAATHWVDDTPYNVLHADELLQMFPDARFVHIYRDPRDVVTSSLTKTWGGDDVSSIARRVSDVLGRWLEVRDRLSTDSYVEMRLEELGSEPTAQLTRVCRSLGLDFDESLLSVTLDKLNAGRWRKELDAKQQEVVGAVLAERLSQYGWDT